MTNKMGGKYRIIKRLADRNLTYRKFDEFEIQMYSKKWYKKGEWKTICEGISKLETEENYKFYNFKSYNEAELYLFHNFVEKHRTIQIDSVYEYDTYNMEIF